MQPVACIACPTLFRRLRVRSSFCLCFIPLPSLLPTPSFLPASTFTVHHCSLPITAHCSSLSTCGGKPGAPRCPGPCSQRLRPPFPAPPLCTLTAEEASSLAGPAGPPPGVRPALRRLRGLLLLLRLPPPGGRPGEPAAPLPGGRGRPRPTWYALPATPPTWYALRGAPPTWYALPGAPPPGTPLWWWHTPLPGTPSLVPPLPGILPYLVRPAWCPLYLVGGIPFLGSFS